MTTRYDLCKTLLNALGIPKGPSGLIDAGTSPHIYYYATTLADILTTPLLRTIAEQHFSHPRGEIVHRVCILLAGYETQDCGALILDFSDHTKLVFTYFSTANPREEFRSLQPPIRRAFYMEGGPTLKMTFQKLPETRIPGILLVDIIRQYLQHGRLSTTLDEQAIYHRYRSLLARQQQRQHAAQEAAAPKQHPLTKKTVAVASHVYQNSYIGLGGALSRWVSTPIINHLSNTWFSKLLSDCCEFTIESTIIATTLSPHLARKGKQAFRVLTSSKNLPGTCQAAGAVAGGILTFSTSYYHMGKMLLLYPLALKLTPKWQPANVILTCMALTSSAEALYFRSYRYLVMALGGLAGSRGAKFTAQKLIPDLQVPKGKKMTQDQAVALFSASIIGMELGRLGAALSCQGADFSIFVFRNIQHKLEARQLAIEGMQEIVGNHYQHLEFPKIAKHPSLWFNQKNPGIYFWVNDTGTFKSECDIEQYWGLVNCSSPEPLPALLPPTK